MLEYARWKYWLILLVTLFALLFAMPNFFGEDDALQIARKDRAPIDATAQKSVEDFLTGKQVAFTRSYIDNGRLMVLFRAVPAQLQARDAVNEGLGNDYVTALTRASRAPEWLRKVGLRPMPLGLDLRGGLYLLYQVDVDGAVDQLLAANEQIFRRALSAEKLAYTDVAVVASQGSDRPNTLRVSLPAGTDAQAARATLAKAVPDLTYSVTEVGANRFIEALLTPAQLKARQEYAIQQNITTLRNRVNELGVSEPIVQKQGADRINVQLPGVQNSAEVKDILGKVATLEFRLVDMQNNPVEAQQRGRAPLGSKLYLEDGGRPLLLKRDIIATGDQLIDATSTTSQNGPAVSVKLDAAAAEEMFKTTRANVNKNMAVVLVEQTQQTSTINGEKVTRQVITQKIISNATIRGVFSNSFEITGLTQSEARELALLMRSGQLAAPLVNIQERAIGPSLGQASIDKGVKALLVGMLGVFAFMAIYYKIFGLIADLVLLANVVLLTALLSMMGSALSLPGIAGILLTVGVAVDANVLIYERIREELRNGVTPQAAIRAGFEKAFSAIADSNVTTIIAGLVLWVFGTGPIRGFAVVLTLGIATSMFTSLMGSRALLTLLYGGTRKPAKLHI
ncbi:MAG: protein translocase subunit SecD [Steroidobacteraceae bacterium]